MVAAKATSLMVAMAVLGVVPVAAHAQTIDILELVDQEVSEKQVSAPNQEESAANVDEDVSEKQVSAPNQEESAANVDEDVSEEQVSAPNQEESAANVDEDVSEEQVSAPNQEESAANVDEDTFMPTNIVFATVGPFGTLNVDFTSTINDEDALANSQTETQSADINQIPTLIQSPTFTIDDLLGLLPA
jgi:hypothetical protein